jgi:hypothetical protein
MRLEHNVRSKIKTAMSPPSAEKQFAGLFFNLPQRRAGLAKRCPQQNKKNARWPISRVLYPLLGDDHSSRRAVTNTLKRRTRVRGQHPLPACAGGTPISSCSRWGLPCRCCYQQRGALLPHLFTLTSPLAREAVCFLWHFPLGYPRRALPATVLAGARTFLGECSPP